MLYITTRNHYDAFTAYHTLNNDLANDGGRYVPFHLPVYSREDLQVMLDKPFNEIIADVLNLFFSARLTGWDIDISVGKHTAQLLPMNHRIIMTELWHNMRNDYSFFIDQIYTRLIQKDDVLATATEWVKISVHIAFLFAVYAQLIRDDLAESGQTVDISVPVDDFAMPVAALYAKKMGLPIGMIICTNESNSAAWDLIHRAAFNTADASPNLIGGFERLLNLIYGDSEVLRLCDSHNKARTYVAPEDKTALLSSDLFCVVVGNDRVHSMINRIYRSSGHIADPKAALCYAGLQDYRAKTGVNNLTLLLSAENPLNHATAISAATGLSNHNLYEILNSPKE